MVWRGQRGLTMWDTIFGIVNLVALVMWGALIGLPRRPALLSLVLYAGVGLLCLAYALGLTGVLTGTLATGESRGGAVDFTTIEGVRSIFASDAGATIGWTHYLALDLFTGLWIARDADRRGFARLLQAPVLLLTFVAGPFGLLLWLCLRKARRKPALDNGDTSDAI